MATPEATRPHAFAATLKSFTTACGKGCRCYSLLTLAGKFPNVRRLPVSMRIATEPGELWERIKGVAGTTYSWPRSTYIAEPPFFATFTMKTEATNAIYTGARGLKCSESVPDAALQPQSDAQLVITCADGSRTALAVLLRIDTPIEVDHYRAGGILLFVLRQLLQNDPAQAGATSL